MDGWMDDLRFNVPFNSISVISGQWVDDNERLCAMELCLRLRRFRAFLVHLACQTDATIELTFMLTLSACDNQYIV